MSDTFRDLIEASVGDMMNTAGQAVADKAVNKGKEYANRFLAALGSARGAGNYDLTVVLNDLRDSWKYWLTTQRSQPTIATFVDFVNVVFGLNMPEDAIYTAIYGFDPMKSPKPPQIIAPNKAVMDGNLKVIFNPRSAQPNLLTASQNLVRAAESNPADQNYLTLMLKWKTAQQDGAAIVNRPGTEPLKGFNHGGMLDTETTEKILTKFASKLIRDGIIAHMKGEAPAAAGGAATGDASTDPNASGEAVPNPDNKSKVASANGTISIDPPSMQERANWGGLVPPKTAAPRLKRTDVMHNMQRIAFATYDFNVYAQKAADDQFWTTMESNMQKLPFQKVNAMSAQLMSIVSAYPANAFVAAMTIIQKQNGVTAWPTANMQAAYAFMRAGGNFDEVTAELNHFCNNAAKASLIYVGLQRLVAKEDARRAPQAPAAAPAAPAAPAAAPAAPAAPGGNP